ncbi:MAG: hypothetical protein KH128_04070 [Firmicutes bacterium]|nr:hypothetical protein [Bacillota bacterium]
MIKVLFFYPVTGSLTVDYPRPGSRKTIEDYGTAAGAGASQAAMTAGKRI